MRRPIRQISLAALIAAAPAAAIAQEGDPAFPGLMAGAPGTLGVEVVSAEFSGALYLTSPPDDPRLFVVQQRGLIRIVENGEIADEPFLDLSGTVTQSGFEQGLLGLAFHPDYADNGRFFVTYTDAEGTSHISEFAVSDNPGRAAADSEKILMTYAQPAGNHNGGWLGFGPDGLLYISTGDGGGGGDPFGTGQNEATVLAKILRIDVNGMDGELPYAIPEGNPYPEAPEAWAMGLRNPWRAAFDGENLYIADVGQNIWEWVHVITTADAGTNFGWSIVEGSHCFGADTCDTEGLTLPVYEFDRRDNAACSITGGYVYRGSAIPALEGHYLFSDWCAGFLHSFVYEDGEATQLTDWTAQIGNVGRVTSFGQDSEGELYIINATTVFKIVPGGE